jgi:ABC-type lipoprotein export system ATPase subunit
MVTHDMHYARHAKRIVRISDGQVVDEDELAGTRPSNAFQQIFEGQY